MSDEENKETKLTGIRLVLYWANGILGSLVSLAFLILSILGIYYQTSPVAFVFMIIGIWGVYRHRYFIIFIISNSLVWPMAGIATIMTVLLGNIMATIMMPIIIISEIRNIFVFDYRNVSNPYNILHKFFGVLCLLWGSCAYLICIFVIYSQAREWITIHWIIEIPIALFLGIIISSIPTYDNPIIGYSIGAFLAVKLWGWSWVASVALLPGLPILLLALQLASVLEKRLRK